MYRLRTSAENIEIYIRTRHIRVLLICLWASVGWLGVCRFCWLWALIKAMVYHTCVTWCSPDHFDHFSLAFLSNTFLQNPFGSLGAFMMLVLSSRGHGDNVIVLVMSTDRLRSVVLLQCHCRTAHEIDIDVSYRYLLLRSLGLLRDSQTLVQCLDQVSTPTVRSTWLLRPIPVPSTVRVMMRVIDEHFCQLGRVVCDVMMIGDDVISAIQICKTSCKISV